MPTFARHFLLTFCLLFMLTACQRKPDTELGTEALGKKYGKVVAMEFHLKGDEIEEMISKGRSEFSTTDVKVKTSSGTWQLESMPLDANEAGRILLHVKGHAKSEGAVALSFWTFWTDKGKIGPGLYESKMEAGEAINRILVGEQVYMTSEGQVAPSLDLEKIENLQLEQLDVLVLKGRNPNEYNWIYVYLVPALIFGIVGFWLKRR